MPDCFASNVNKGAMCNKSLSARGNRKVNGLKEVLVAEIYLEDETKLKGTHDTFISMISLQDMPSKISSTLVSRRKYYKHLFLHILDPTINRNLRIPNTSTINTPPPPSSANVTTPPISSPSHNPLIPSSSPPTNSPPSP